jgi:hypothetical protein
VHVVIMNQCGHTFHSQNLALRRTFLSPHAANSSTHLMCSLPTLSSVKSEVSNGSGTSDGRSFAGSWSNVAKAGYCLRSAAGRELFITADGRGAAPILSFEPGLLSCVLIQQRLDIAARPASVLEWQSRTLAPTNQRARPDVAWSPRYSSQTTASCRSQSVRRV